MKEDYSELIEYLDKKFTTIDERFDSVDERFANIDSQLSDIKEDVRDLKETKVDKSDFNNLLTAVDSYSKKADTYFQDPVKITS